MAEFDEREFIDCIRAVLGLDPIPNFKCNRARENRLHEHFPNLSIQRAQSELGLAALNLFEGTAMSASKQARER